METKEKIAIQQTSEAPRSWRKWGRLKKNADMPSIWMPSFQNCDSGSFYWVKSSHVLHFVMKLNSLSQSSH